MSSPAVRRLPQLPVFDSVIQRNPLPLREQTKASLARVKQIILAYNLTEDDIRDLSPAFWALHVDPIVCIDPAATLLLTVQLNLVAGTITSYVDQQPDLRSVLERLLRFEISGHFCLTEVDHGLDIANAETTATLQTDGTFELNTPHLGAAKFLPSTVPCGMPSIAVVFARLIVQGKECGVRPFIVSINDGTQMSPGVTARMLPPRGGSQPLCHSITTFERVKLPSTALLGDVTTEDYGRLEFFQSIWRVPVGGLSLASLTIPSMQMSAFIAGRYSQRRTTGGARGARVPIITYKTQYTPILLALAQSFVLKEFWKYATAFFCDDAQDPRVRTAIGTIMKAICIQHSQTANLTLSDRCGAQGLFNHNQISLLHADLRGLAIAEGDVLGVSIRLACELVLGRLEVPPPLHPSGLLARHELGLLQEAQASVAGLGPQRSPAFDAAVLPRAERLVQSIGHRMAHDAAVAAGLDARITDLYLASTVRLDEGWYVENAGLGRAAQFAVEDAALRVALPELDAWLDRTGVAEYVRAPIVSKERWAAFVDGLEVFAGLEVKQGYLTSRL